MNFNEELRDRVRYAEEVVIKNAALLGDELQPVVGRQASAPRYDEGKLCAVRRRPSVS